jgi:hypothetical protein
MVNCGVGIGITGGKRERGVCREGKKESGGK